ncbi:hypothetical protein KAFR_0D02970 [Kazachstania africana CBS 2517]|uniref:Dihydrofolate synthetase n=1 Tax=Kazachstania africana (strain ATCC 22294 / BCRC 22015 / CBS 2517 / CECT 1963 / NBRC 1671 / NRRL Y-8276) TaxID=1071382 RepID=H2AU95_KAZAF|nr:hypothetical protein KAFR_0D02970 [Kazachstania africana CBS 2517]CCF57945.1 hypothetical protein KAFR_0D02970 [Kazachstania africana CBS 2517]
MAIELGLSRISKLLKYAGNPQDNLKVLHVAGTNGKGSVCSYMANLLSHEKKRTENRIGKFTSPHLIHITDSIMVNNKSIPLDDFNLIRKSLSKINEEHSLHCSEFELLTGIALSYFRQRECTWCVLEVGLGGRLDATNFIPGSQKYACGITKIGLDHESFLGTTLKQIAFEKAGIIREGVPYAVIDGSNSEAIIDVVRKQCESVSCTLKITNPSISDNSIESVSWGTFKPKKLPLNGEYQIFNVRVAVSILDHLQQSGEIFLSKDDLLQGLTSLDWPGRLQRIDYQYHKNNSMSILMDGAHNGSAAVELAKFIKQEHKDKPLTFVTAVTSGKKLGPLFDPLITSKDKVIVTRFGPVTGMPWIQPTDPEQLACFLKERYNCGVEVQPNVHELFPNLAKQSRDSPVIVCGSLYLCGELLRIHNHNISNKS